eukprot:365832-Chlamydomonas_euryale.AAC.16
MHSVHGHRRRRRHRCARAGARSRRLSLATADAAVVGLCGRRCRRRCRRAVGTRSICRRHDSRPRAIIGAMKTVCCRSSAHGVHACAGCRAGCHRVAHLDRELSARRAGVARYDLVFMERSAPEQQREQLVDKEHRAATVWGNGAVGRVAALWAGVGPQREQPINGEHRAVAARGGSAGKCGAATRGAGRQSTYSCGQAAAKGGGEASVSRGTGLGLQGRMVGRTSTRV